MKRGDVKSFSHAEGGGGGGALKRFHSLKGGVQKVLPCLNGGGGGRKTFRTLEFPICSSLSP